MEWIHATDHAPKAESSEDEFLFTVKLKRSGIVTIVHVSWLYGDIKDWHIMYNENRTLHETLGEYELIKWLKINKNS